MKSLLVTLMIFGVAVGRVLAGARSEAAVGTKTVPLHVGPAEAKADLEAFFASPDPSPDAIAYVVRAVKSLESVDPSYYDVEETVKTVAQRQWAAYVPGQALGDADRVKWGVLHALAQYHFSS